MNGSAFRSTRNPPLLRAFFHVSLAFERLYSYSATRHPDAPEPIHNHSEEERNSMASPLSKSKIIAHLADKVSTPEKPVSKKQISSFFDELFKLAVKESKSAGKFVIPGIGRAVKAHRKARMGRNPATGEAIKIKAKTVVRLRAAKAFKDAVLK
jgi:DNA-binding protein HU-beta